MHIVWFYVHLWCDFMCISRVLIAQKCTCIKCCTLSRLNSFASAHPSATWLSRAKISEIHHWQYTFLNTPLKKNTPQHGHRGVILTQTRVILTHSTDVLQKKSTCTNCHMLLSCDQLLFPHQHSFCRWIISLVIGGDFGCSGHAWTESTALSLWYCCAFTTMIFDCISCCCFHENHLWTNNHSS